MKNIIKTMITWGELADRIICLELNLSAGTMIGLSLSNSLMTSLRRVVSIRREARYKLNSYSFSYWDKNGESSGVEGITKKPMMPTRTVNNPSCIKGIEDSNKDHNIALRTIMKIQAHPALPPTPSMLSMAAASNPEKAPDSWGTTSVLKKRFTQNL